MWQTPAIYLPKNHLKFTDKTATKDKIRKVFPITTS